MMTTDEAFKYTPDVINVMRLRGESGDYYLHCEHWTGRIFVELSMGAFLIAVGPNGQPILEPVEPYRPLTVSVTNVKESHRRLRRRWWFWGPYVG